VCNLKILSTAYHLQEHAYSSHLKREKFLKARTIPDSIYVEGVSAKELVERKEMGV
jgi:hypothetical protein